MLLPASWLLGCIGITHFIKLPLLGWFLAITYLSYTRLALHTMSFDILWISLVVGLWPLPILHINLYSILFLHFHNMLFLNFKLSLKIILSKLEGSISNISLFKDLFKTLNLLGVFFHCSNLDVGIVMDEIWKFIFPKLLFHVTQILNLLIILGFLYLLI